MSIKEHLNRLIPRTKRFRASLLAVLILGTVLAFGVIVSSTSAGPGSPFGGQITSVFIAIAVEIIAYRQPP